MDVRSVQDSGTMPLIAEIVLAVSVGCVEIRNNTTHQEGYEMDSYQVPPPHRPPRSPKADACRAESSSVCLCRKGTWSVYGSSGWRR